MEAYQEFASVYDIFMEEIPYDQWLAFIKQIWQLEKLEPKMIADLGCGTGNVLLPLAKEGYEMTGVDVSFDMLTQAEHKLREAGIRALLLEQDMTEFVLPQKADCILSLCDSLNYLTEDGELTNAFCQVKENLAEEGIFIFDLNTEYKFCHVYGQNTYAAVEDDAAYIWENFYDEGEKINEYAVNFFLRRDDGSYERTEEVHYERAYALEEIKQALLESGLEMTAVYDDYSFSPICEESQRICVVAKHRKR